MVESGRCSIRQPYDQHTTTEECLYISSTTGIVAQQLSLRRLGTCNNKQLGTRYQSTSDDEDRGRSRCPFRHRCPGRQL
eukprot:1028285-Prorocentrum_lima.AAC.1